jgi:flagellar hook-associated protein 3 FlgL
MFCFHWADERTETMMRISTQNLFETGGARIGDLQASLSRTQQQISSGRRILVPSDDPAGTARALDITQSQSLNTQYGLNRQSAKNALSATEGTLSSVTSVLQDVKAATIAAGNGALSDRERGFIDTELRGRLDELVGLANARDGLGNYMFSGFQTSTPAFVQSASGVQYQGDQGQRLMRVDAERQIAVSSPGQSVFQGNGQDVFRTMSDLITLLETPGAPGLTAGLASANGKLDLAFESVLTARAVGGAHLQELDALDNAGEDRNIQYSKALSDLQDLDYAKALTQLSQQQTTLEAAQRSFVTISRLSLFTYL